MNKLLILVLALCLVSSHAFVKRDAPVETTPSPLDVLQKQGQEIFEAAKKALTENLEMAKTGAEKLYDDLQKQLNAGVPKKEGSSS